jgi:imidazolonepropionase-like amidohydrolase
LGGMATVNPAKVAQVWNRKGSLAPGKDADLVVLDDDHNVVWSVVITRTGGEPIAKQSSHHGRFSENVCAYC